MVSTKQKTDKLITTILQITIVTAIGLLALNQAFKWYYKIEFLKTPCQLCADLNPDLSECINGKGVKMIYENCSQNNLYKPINITSMIPYLSETNETGIEIENLTSEFIYPKPFFHYKKFYE